MKYVTSDSLIKYEQCLNEYEYINMKTELAINKSTNCPSCGAPITSSKCEYCGTDFEASAMWGMAM